MANVVPIHSGQYAPDNGQQTVRTEQTGRTIRANSAKRVDARELVARIFDEKASARGWSSTQIGIRIGLSETMVRMMRAGTRQIDASSLLLLGSFGLDVLESVAEVLRTGRKQVLARERAACRYVAKSSAVHAEISTALEDGQIDDHEAERIRRAFVDEDDAEREFRAAIGGVK